MTFANMQIGRLQQMKGGINREDELLKKDIHRCMMKPS
jgi:hypothetical protein